MLYNEWKQKEFNVQGLIDERKSVGKILGIQHDFESRNLSLGCT